MVELSAELLGIIVGLALNSPTLLVILALIAAWTGFLIFGEKTIKRCGRRYGFAPNGVPKPMRWALTVLAAILVLGIADESSKMTTGLTFLALQTQGVSKALAIDEASSIRTPTMALAVSLPLGLWILVCLWTPTSGLGKALRFGLWPPVLLSSFLGGPIALALRGIQTQLLSVSETFIGLIVLSIPATTCFIFLGFKLRREMPDNTNRHNMKK